MNKRHEEEIVSYITTTNIKVIGPARLQ